MKALLTITCAVLCLTHGPTERDGKSHKSHKKVCKRIDTLVTERYEWKTGNYYANRIIPILEEESGIEATCERGTFGHFYRSDSTFDADVERWREYLKCKPK